MKKSLIQILTILFSLLIISACSAHKVESKPVIAEASTAPIAMPKKLEDKASPSVPQKNMQKCVCVQLWMPVCGENEKTYSNACFAQCAGVKFKQGSCSKIISD